MSRNLQLFVGFLQFVVGFLQFVIKQERLLVALRHDVEVMLQGLVVFTQLLQFLA